MSQENPNAPDDESPPLLGSWRNIYIFVLVLHVILIISFYFFSQAYA
jgi:hypothetical protein